jgi:hypothetical protein
MLFGLTDEFSQIILAEVRRFFAEHPIAQDYRYSPDEESSKIWIVEQFPDARHRFPSITVKGVVGDSQELGLNQMAEPLYDAEGRHVGDSLQGVFNPRVDYIVESESDSDTKKIADTLAMALVADLRVSIPRKCEGGAVVIPPIVRVAGRGTRPFTNTTVIHQIVLTQTWQVTWFEQVLYPDNLENVVPTVTVTDC